MNIRCKVFAIAAVMLLPPLAAAQAYPDKPIRVIVPVPAGGTPDVVARLVAPGLSSLLGQQLVIDNRGGAGALIGTELAARAVPDGYTLFIGTPAHAINSSFFRVYVNDDVIGVELCAAAKNVIALAAGMLEGLGLGQNTRAALITRGLAEITRLGVAMGADPLTFAGLTGMGDLILTATGALSRNRTLGFELGRGKSFAEAQRGKRTVAEGANTARSAVALGERHGVELPIAREVSAILFEGKEPTQAVTDLMDRALKAEVWR